MCRSEGALAGVSCPETAKELEAILNDAPDLQGVAFLAAAPDHSAAPEEQIREMPSKDHALMLRLDFLGHLYLERLRLPWAAKRPAVGVQVEAFLTLRQWQQPFLVYSPPPCLQIPEYLATKGMHCDGTPRFLLLRVSLTLQLTNNAVSCTGHQHVTGTYPGGTLEPSPAGWRTGGVSHPPEGILFAHQIRQSILSRVQSNVKSLEEFCAALKVLTPENQAKQRMHAPQLRPERPHLAEEDLICDLTVHNGIASKAIQDWRVVAGTPW